VANLAGLAGIKRDEMGRLWTVQINLYAVLRKEPNWSGGNRAYWLKGIVGYTPPWKPKARLANMPSW
jgi:hypothetical protein